MSRLAVLLAVLGLVAGLWIGHGWGKGERADQIAVLTGQAADLGGQLALAREVNSGNASQLTSLRDTLKGERDRRQKIEQAAQAELAARADRIAALERAAAGRRASITKEANADEDCAALRTIPVCAAVAERLWPDDATARPH